MAIDYVLFKNLKSKARNSKKKFRKFRKKLSPINIKDVKKNIKLSNSKIIIIFLIIFLLIGSSYAVFDYRKISNLIKEAEQFTKEEKHKEAIEKLTVAQVSWFVENLGIRKEKINDEIRENEQMFIDKEKYNEALLEIDEKDYKNAIIILLDLPESSYYYQNAQIKIKESENFLLESELVQVKEAKRIADQRRMQREQELAEKEAEERTMNADNDGDGLTYREELSKGTSDWNIDSDGDEIQDNLDSHPAGGGRDHAQFFEWTYKGVNWEHKLSIPGDWYEYYKNKPREDHGTVYVTPDDTYIQKIAQQLKNTAEKEGYHKTSFVLSFIQGLPYVEDYYTSFNEYPKYPIETIVDRNGDCEDTSYLLASLIDAMDIGVALIEFNNHMGVGVSTVHSQSGYYYPIGDRWYYYYETTGKDWNIGELPNEYIYQQAKVTRSWEQEGQYIYAKYKKPCHASSDFSGYYQSNDNYYSDSQCNYQIYCLPFSGYYYNSNDEQLYHDSGCNQIVTKGCYKSTSYPGYFYSGNDFYYDSRCIREAKICRPSTIYSNEYWDGDYSYWDSSCTQRIVSWCTKSTYNPGYFFNSLDYYYYYDYQCTQKANL